MHSIPAVPKTHLRLPGSVMVKHCNSKGQDLWYGLTFWILSHIGRLEIQRFNIFPFSKLLLFTCRYGCLVQDLSCTGQSQKSQMLFLTAHKQFNYRLQTQNLMFYRASWSASRDYLIFQASPLVTNLQFATAVISISQEKNEGRHFLIRLHTFCSQQLTYPRRRHYPNTSHVTRSSSRGLTKCQFISPQPSFVNDQFCFLPYLNAVILQSKNAGAQLVAVSHWEPRQKACVKQHPGFRPGPTFPSSQASNHKSAAPGNENKCPVSPQTHRKVSHGLQLIP